MKIRNGFVSNSSSSSFAILTNLNEAKQIFDERQLSYFEDGSERILTSLLYDNLDGYYEIKGELDKNNCYYEPYVDGHEAENGEHIFVNGNHIYGSVPLKLSEFEVEIKRK